MGDRVPVSRDVAVIIPCRNGGSTLRVQLESLAQQECLLQWEVVIVDDQSTDDSVEVSASFQDRLQIRIVANDGPRGAANSRNLGARIAQADRLLFLDADDAVSPGYVQAMGHALFKHGIVTALVDFHKLNGSDSAAKSPRPSGSEPHRMFGFLPHAGAGALGVQRPLFEALGGFDASLPWLHDADLCWRAYLQEDATLFIVRDAVEYVRLRQQLYSLYRQGLANGRDGIRLRDRYTFAGVPAMTWSRHARQWCKTLRALGGIRTEAGRCLVAWRLGKQIGRLRGLLSLWWEARMAAMKQ